MPAPNTNAAPIFNCPPAFNFHSITRSDDDKVVTITCTDEVGDKDDIIPGGTANPLDAQVTCVGDVVAPAVQAPVIDGVKVLTATCGEQIATYWNAAPL